MPWWFGVIERRHDLQNPTSAEKIRLLGERLGLGPALRVLDLAGGKAGPARVLAETYGCRITCVEQAEEFVATARKRVHAAGLDHLIEVVHADAREFPFEREGYDAALCLGASFIWDGLPGTLSALVPAVRPRGFVVVGEPYWRRWPLPSGVGEDVDGSYVTLAETADRFEGAGLVVVGLIASSPDDWDRYETLHWLALDEWLHDHPSSPDAVTFRERGRLDRERYLLWQRELLGWAIFIGRLAG